MSQVSSAPRPSLAHEHCTKPACAKRGWCCVCIIAVKVAGLPVRADVANAVLEGHGA